jgi:hypothetical protein
MLRRALVGLFGGHTEMAEEAAAAAEVGKAIASIGGADTEMEASG